MAVVVVVASVAVFGAADHEHGGELVFVTMEVVGVLQSGHDGAEECGTASQAMLVVNDHYNRQGGWMSCLGIPNHLYDSPRCGVLSPSDDQT